mmetsp:Transcript_56197/g.150038  ORF Transcript_56197/g.150038 Transcript_56197/m.150038 type:complete len:158 (-) Transcript_56197:4093-4566(-)
MRAWLLHNKMATNLLRRTESPRARRRHDHWTKLTNSGSSILNFTPWQVGSCSNSAWARTLWNRTSQHWSKNYPCAAPGGSCGHREALYIEALLFALPISSGREFVLNGGLLVGEFPCDSGSLDRESRDQESRSFEVPSLSLERDSRSRVSSPSRSRE